MGPWSLPSMNSWHKNPIRIPPDTPQAWLRLALWQIWMGTLICGALGFGVALIVTAPSRVIVMKDLSACYGPPPVPQPCDRVAYQTGTLDALFTMMCGVMLAGVALWFLWELWNVSEPKPITDDFLKLLDDSFGHNWRNPRTWPWARMAWAYGFAMVGAASAAAIGLTVWTMVAASMPAKAPKVQVDTQFTVGKSM